MQKIDRKSVKGLIPSVYIGVSSTPIYSKSHLRMGFETIYKIDANSLNDDTNRIAVNLYLSDEKSTDNMTFGII